MFDNLKQHHIGCLVTSIEAFKKENSIFWDEFDYSQVFYITKQDVKVCFIKKTGGIALELVEPGSSNKSLKNLLVKGITYYHLGFTTTCYDKAVEKMTLASCHQLTEFSSEAFKGKRCSFFYHRDLKLIELIEAE